MAIDPRLPIAKEANHLPMESDWRRLIRRLDEILRELMRPKYYEAGTVTIVAGLTTGTATLRKAASLVVVTGFQGGGYTSIVGVLSVDGTTVNASRNGTFGDLVISF